MYSAPTELRRRMSRCMRATREVRRRRCASRSTSPDLDVQQADAVRPTRPLSRPPASIGTARARDRDRCGGCRTASACRCSGCRRIRAAAEAEEPLVLEEELALLGKEEAEAGQVDLLLVGLDLREIGVVGEVGREVRRHAVLRVEAERPANVVVHPVWPRRSVVRSEVTNGLTSSAREPGGTSMPTIVGIA